MLVFLHIPKTAGSTLKNIVAGQYDANHLKFIDGVDPDGSLRETIKNNELLNKGLIFGHFDYGIVGEDVKNVKYVSILRHPVERIISHYYYVLNTPIHYLHNYVKENDISLKDYVKEGLTNELNNGQTRMLIGAGGYHKNSFSKYDIPYGKCDKWMLDEAIENIQNKFVFVGVQEEFDKSIILIKKKLNWKRPLAYLSANQNKKKPKNIDEETINIIKEYNHLDCDLYEYVKNKFESECMDNRLYLLKEGLKIKIRNGMIKPKRKLKSIIKVILFYKNK